MDEMFEIIKAGAPDGPPEQALYRIQQTYSDGSGGRLNVDWTGLHRLHDLIHDRIAMEGCVCETCSTRGCHHPATWEIECRGRLLVLQAVNPGRRRQMDEGQSTLQEGT